MMSKHATRRAACIAALLAAGLLAGQAHAGAVFQLYNHVPATVDCSLTGRVTGLDGRSAGNVVVVHSGMLERGETVRVELPDGIWPMELAFDAQQQAHTMSYKFHSLKLRCDTIGRDAGMHERELIIHNGHLVTPVPSGGSPGQHAGWINLMGEHETFDGMTPSDASVISVHLTLWSQPATAEMIGRGAPMAVTLVGEQNLPFGMPLHSPSVDLGTRLLI